MQKNIEEFDDQISCDSRIIEFFASLNSHLRASCCGAISGQFCVAMKSPCKIVSCEERVMMVR